MQGQRHTSHRGMLQPNDRKGYWTCRGTVPVRTASGVARKRTEIGARDSFKTKAQCQAECDRLNAFYEQRALEDKKQMTFAEAWQSYIESGKPAPKYSARLLDTFGMMNVRDIDGDLMVRTQKTFGIKQTPQTLKRHLYAPVMAIMNMAAKSGVCDRPNFTLPKGYGDIGTPKTPPPDDWYPQVLPLLPLKLQALLVYLTIQGRRLGETLRIKWDHVDLDRGCIEVGKTKNGDSILVMLHPMTAKLIGQLDRDEKYIFGYKPTQYGGDAARKLLHETCDRHSIPYYSPHVLGRHAFARRMLKAGYSLQHVKDAGGWKTLAVLSKHYGHMAHNETSQAILRSAEGLSLMIESKV